ncbi:MAG: lytic transglycosylase [Hyphomicrobiales bacterium]|nr:lytic transglycosylase domain-containing protein [Hyphomicrobiales bacterium]PCH51331.1 MAG: lytic transglycosylase [Hyphomicrobiales bacterium]
MKLNSISSLLFCIFLSTPLIAKSQEKPVPPKISPSIQQICLKISAAAQKHNLPPSYFARLIWKESRFDHLALSPVGAQGIAQFMPATAKLRGLKNPYNYDEAISASASLLSDLKEKFGNLGLASAAYNAGSGRVNGWLSGKRYLPLETEDYVLSITGEIAETFTDKKHAIYLRPLEPTLNFIEACKKLPIIMSRTKPMAKIIRKPWGIQIAGNFKKSSALRTLKRLRARIPSLKKYKAYTQRRKTPMGKKSIYAVRIGANNKKEANSICIKLRRAGGACIVSKN